MERGQRYYGWQHMPSADSGDFTLVSSSTPSVEQLPGVAIGGSTALAALVFLPGHSVEQVVGCSGGLAVTSLRTSDCSRGGLGESSGGQMMDVGAPSGGRDLTTGTRMASVSTTLRSMSSTIEAGSLVMTSEGFDAGAVEPPMR